MRKTPHKLQQMVKVPTPPLSPPVIGRSARIDSQGNLRLLLHCLRKPEKTSPTAIGCTTLYVRLNALARWVYLICNVLQCIPADTLRDSLRLVSSTDSPLRPALSPLKFLCLGLGSPAESREARAQLAFLLAACDDLSIVCISSVLRFHSFQIDPCTTGPIVEITIECDFLLRSFLRLLCVSRSAPFILPILRTAQMCPCTILSLRIRTLHFSGR